MKCPFWIRPIFRGELLVSRKASASFYIFLKSTGTPKIRIVVSGGTSMVTQHQMKVPCLSKSQNFHKFQALFLYMYIKPTKDHWCKHHHQSPPSFSMYLYPVVRYQTPWISSNPKRRPVSRPPYYLRDFTTTQWLFLVPL